MAGAPLQPDRLDLEIVDVDEIVSQVCSSIALEHEEIVRLNPEYVEGVTPPGRAVSLRNNFV